MTSKKRKNPFHKFQVTSKHKKKRTKLAKPTKTTSKPIKPQKQTQTIIILESLRSPPEKMFIIKDKLQIKIGRDPKTCSVAFPPKDRMISHQHCQIFKTTDDSNNQWFIMDNNSTNGLRINNIIIKPSIKHPLKDGDNILFGTKTSSLNFYHPYKITIIDDQIQSKQKELKLKEQELKRREKEINRKNLASKKNIELLKMKIKKENDLTLKAMKKKQKKEKNRIQKQLKNAAKKENETQKRLELIKIQNKELTKNQQSQNLRLAQQKKELEQKNENNSESMEDDITCCMCYDILMSAKSLKCGHTMCHQCITQWIDAKPQSSCPICRKSIEHEPISCLTLDTIIKEHYIKKQSKEIQMEFEKRMESYKLWLVAYKNNGDMVFDWNAWNDGGSNGNLVNPETHHQVLNVWDANANRRRVLVIDSDESDTDIDILTVDSSSSTSLDSSTSEMSSNSDLSESSSSSDLENIYRRITNINGIDFVLRRRERRLMQLTVSQLRMYMVANSLDIRSGIVKRELVDIIGRDLSIMVIGNTV